MKKVFDKKGAKRKFSNLNNIVFHCIKIAWFGLKRKKKQEKGVRKKND